jgi:hypothetical protein
MKTTIAILAAIALLAAGSAQADGIRPDHPLLGVWKLSFPDGSCEEVYRISANGRILITSAEEVGESTFTVTDQPLKSGFYKWVDKVIKTNGKPDCSGEITPVGDVATLYVVFEPSGNRFLMCAQERMESCFAPLVRVTEGQI